MHVKQTNLNIIINEEFITITRDQISDNKTDIVNKLSIEDYNAFLILTKLEYEAGLIKEQSPSELLRFTIGRLLIQLRNNRIYHLLLLPQ